MRDTGQTSNLNPMMFAILWNCLNWGGVTQAQATLKITQTLAVTPASVMKWSKMKREPHTVMITYTDGSREQIKVNKKMRVLDTPSLKNSILLFVGFIVVLYLLGD